MLANKQGILLSEEVWELPFTEKQVQETQVLQV